MQYVVCSVPCVFAVSYVHIVQCAVSSVWSAVCSVLFCIVQCLLCRCIVQCVVCSVQLLVWSVQCGVRSVQCAVWSLQFAVCSWQCAVCSTLRVQCAKVPPAVHCYPPYHQTSFLLWILVISFVPYKFEKHHVCSLLKKRTTTWHGGIKESDKVIMTGYEAVIKRDYFS